MPLSHPGDQDSLAEGETTSRGSSTRRSLDDVLSVFRSARATPVTAEVSAERRARLERLAAAVEQLKPLLEKYGSNLSYMEPAGRDGRSLDTEFKEFLGRRKTEPAAVPSFTYPKLVGVEMGADLEEVRSIRERLSAEPDPHVRQVALHALALAEDTIAHLAAIQRGDDAAVMEIQHRMYGGVSPELAGFAGGVFERRIGPMRAKEEPHPVINALEKNEFDSEEIAKYFSAALRAIGLDDVFRTEIVDDVHALTVQYYPPNGGRPRIAIPTKRVLDGHELLKLIAHEVGTHAVTNANAAANGLPLMLGYDYEMFQEGLAKMSELKVEGDIRNREVTGEDDDDLLPYNVLALEMVQGGANARQVFDRMIRLRARSWIAKNPKPAGKMRDELRKELKLPGDAALTDEQRTTLQEQLEQRAEAKGEKASLTQLRRLFRGYSDLSVGGRAFFKDKIYLEGAMQARRFQQEGLEDVLLRARLDPMVAEHLVEVGLLDGKVRTLVRDVAMQILRRNQDELTMERWLREHRIWYEQYAHRPLDHAGPPDWEEQTELLQPH